jgi:uncharacterized protein (DUF427 family)
VIEHVADYPRPPRIAPDARRVRVVLGGVTILETRSSVRVLETFHPPTWYLPVVAFAPGSLVPGSGSSFCEWKGQARYWDLSAGGVVAEHAAWDYPEPTAGFAAIRDHVALYAGRVDACFVDEERVTPQPGGFYGGWITRDVAGPFKGEPGTSGW